ncbi:hypothetical protein K450DRAFT_251204 [Umbelopsis ramanniana AG]|uniref:Derlin n=1 Tax=Umbelopsis ramanniana AG TaxID=1314678 RepID=A0AAD5E5T0_UMBRA|nr:uncharacterized protein K450DRAFT_251204 [Umbelopsis ramanniana AG]KAI8577673.1 hypothetical protein K450DRAFT_251204 [Umbelopsis ramanniana AG]
MPTPLETWFYEIPPITRAYVTAACLTSLAVQLELVHPIKLWLDYDRILYGNEWWRLITNFLYFGPLSLDFMFHIFFLARYSRMMEESHFRSRGADYAWLLLLSAIALLICSIIVPMADMPFLGSPLAFTLVYIWSRRNPYIRLSFMGVLVFSAPYLPWVLLGFSLLINSHLPMGDVLGIAVGHVYYFLEDVWPREPHSGGRRLLQTPGWFASVVNRMTPTEELDIPVNILDDDPPYTFDSNTNNLENNDERVSSQTDNEMPSAETAAPASANESPS